MNGTWLDFEKPIVDLERRIEDLRGAGAPQTAEVEEELKRLERKAEKLRRDIYAKLTRWQRVKLARHPRRPYTLDYLKVLAPGFLELHGDRRFGDDPAIISGLTTIDDIPIVLIGHQKGRDTKENIHRNFGMANPEGYRKALRLMQLAAKLGCPLVTFVDTPGAYPGLGAEERGQSEAIARNLVEMAHLPVPIVCVVIGEGGSGGALGIAVGDVILMLENSIYSVITPEGCAAITWKDANKKQQAAAALKYTAGEALRLGCVDEVIKEPQGGTQSDPAQAASILDHRLRHHLDELRALSIDTMLERRYTKFRNMAQFYTAE
jgi:acetyl-CoA carboxylase carboxyl transferase subunit alpha